MQTVQETTLVDVTLSDWEGARSTRLEAVPRSATVGELVMSAVHALGLPIQDAYLAHWQGRELHEADTLDEVGLEADSEISLVPDVAAGCPTTSHAR